MSVEIAHEARERAAMERSNTTIKASTRPGGPIRPELEDPNRLKISGPVELLHTTNMLSYNAPDLPRPSTSSHASTNTDNDSDSLPGTALSSPPTSPDVSPSELKPPPSPEPNHLSPYFGARHHGPGFNQAPAAAPAIPQRAPSHTKQASMDAMTRQRSTGRLQKKNGRSLSRSNAPALSPSNSVTASSMSHRSGQSHSSVASSISAPIPIAPQPPHTKPQPPSQPHPFGAELAQVNEMAEEFGINDKKADIFEEEERELISRGLCKFSADVYLHDVEVLTATFFHERDFRHSRPAPALWI